MTTEINADNLNTRADYNNLIDELTYRNFVWNRHYCISAGREFKPDEWRRIYGDNVYTFEARYQAEITKP